MPGLLLLAYTAASQKHLVNIEGRFRWTAADSRCHPTAWQTTVASKSTTVDQYRLYRIWENGAVQSFQKSLI